MTDYNPTVRAGNLTGAAIALDNLADVVGYVNIANGWRDQAVPEGGETAHAITQFALVMTEAAEAIEELRKGNKPHRTYYNPDKPYKPEGVPSELADIVIRCLDIADMFAIDLGWRVAEKLEYNSSRGYRHGGKIA